jgi:hypothetical protein
MIIAVVGGRIRKIRVDCCSFFSQEAIVDGEVFAQNAVNAAIDVLWDAVKVAAKVF